MKLTNRFVAALAVLAIAVLAGSLWPAAARAQCSVCMASAGGGGSCMSWPYGGSCWMYISGGNVSCASGGECLEPQYWYRLVPASGSPTQISATRARHPMQTPEQAIAAFRAEGYTAVLFNGHVIYNDGSPLVSSDATPAPAVSTWGSVKVIYR